MLLRDCDFVLMPPTRIKEEYPFEFWRDRRRESFGMEAFLCVRFKQLRIHTDAVAKIHVEAVETNTQGTVLGGCGLGVQMVFVPWDFDSYKKIDDKDIRAALLCNGMRSALRCWAHSARISPGIFDDALTDFEQQHFQVVGTTKRSWQVPGTACRVKIQYCLFLGSFGLAVLMLNKGGQIIGRSRVLIEEGLGFEIIKVLEHAQWKRHRFGVFKSNIPDRWKLFYRGFTLSLDEIYNTSSNEWRPGFPS